MRNGTRQEDIAIIGMACLFPQARDVDAFWANILGKVDAVTDPPPESWNPELYYDPASSETDRIYCKRGGFLGGLARFDPLANGVPPMAVGGEPDQWLALQIARDALADAGYADLEEDVRHRTAVVLGRGASFNGGTAISVQHSLVVTQTIEIIKTLHPEYTAEELEALREGLKSTLPSMDPQVIPGLVPNVVVGRIANRLDLMGPSYTVDAACASSLVAVQIAVRDLLRGDCDLALAGGSQIWTPMPMLSVFCQLNALSHSQQIRPFDKDADGTILGEGIGMLVLKRLEAAERDGDRIYAVIKGVGVASDGKAVGVMAPRVEGEELALRRAYEDAEMPTSRVGLIEAHGTGTPLGDLTEVQALRRVFGDRQGRLPSVALGSVKSMISHTVPAAGVAGIIKAALSLHHKTLPPTINVKEPNPKFELETTPFYLNTATRPWIKDGDERRVAGVSSFGFGGINAHVVLEEYRPQAPRPKALPDHKPAWDSEVCILEAASVEDLRERVDSLRRFTSLARGGESVRLQDIAFSLAQGYGRTEGQAYRLAIVATSVGDLDEKLTKAAERLADPDCTHIQDRSGVYYTAQPLARDGKVAFLFPGEGSQYANMLADLCLHFPEVRACFEDLDATYRETGREFLPSSFIFPAPTFSAEEKAWVESQLWDMDVAAAAVLTADEALLRLLEGLGVQPDFLAGHSSGEWAALRAAGVFGTSEEERRRWIARDLLDVYRDTINEDDIPAATLLAIGADRLTVDEIVAEVGASVTVAMDNCPHQVVVAMPPEQRDAVLEATRRRSLVVEQLSFDRPYHTPLFGAYTKRLLKALERQTLRSPRLPVYSCATGELFPADGPGIAGLTAGQWTREVRFRETIEKLYEVEGARIFVEVGPRANLSNFVEDALRKRPARIVPMNQQRRTGITQLNHMTGMLAVEGVKLDPLFLFKWRNSRLIDLESAPAPEPVPPPLLKIQFPAMQVPAPVLAQLKKDPPSPREAPAAVAPRTVESVPLPAPAPARISASQPVAPAANGATARPSGPPHAFLSTMQRFLGVQQSVMTAYLRGKPLPIPAVSPALPAASAAPSPSATPISAASPPADNSIMSIEQAITPRFEVTETSAGSGTTDIAGLLVGLVSERTGYPAEAISLDADMEADLGIDSIKRVEILGTFRSRIAGGDAIPLDGLAEMRTLRATLEAVTAARDRY